VFLLRGPCHCCGCGIRQRVSAGRHVPASLTDNDCGSYIRCCSIRANHLSQPWHLFFPWWQQLLLRSRTSR
jgi:hypothetical protein